MVGYDDYSDPLIKVNDDTLHYVHRHLEELRQGPPRRAIEASHVSIGYAMSYTSIIVITGFALLAFSDFMPSALFGLLTGLVMAMALIFDLSLLAVWLNRFVQEPPRLWVGGQASSGGGGRPGAVSSDIGRLSKGMYP